VVTGPAFTITQLVNSSDMTIIDAIAMRIFFIVFPPVEPISIDKFSQDKPDTEQ
jgi:hypothetical protein